MIWGKTDRYINAKFKEKRKWFAWYPVYLDDGRAVWLQYVYRRGVFYIDSKVYIYTLN